MNLKITGHFNVSKLVVSMNKIFFLGGGETCRIKTHYLKSLTRVSRTKEGKNEVNY